MISEFSHKDASPWILQAYESKTLHAQCPGPNRYMRLFHSVLRKISFSAGILSTKNLATTTSSYRLFRRNRLDTREVTAQTAANIPCRR